jgi:hypothetical protein
LSACARVGLGSEDEASAEAAKAIKQLIWHETRQG